MLLVWALALLLFVVRLAFAPHAAIVAQDNDFFQYIELGKNIFERGDFTVFHSPGGRVSYPPIFSILIHLLTNVTGDPLRAIQWLNSFALSFFVVPLFWLFRDLLGRRPALIFSLFLATAIPINAPLNGTSAHFFYLFELICVAWLTWRALKQPAVSFACAMGLGLLLAVTILTKEVGLPLLLVVPLLLVFFRTTPTAPRPRLRLRLATALLVVGAALPLLIVHQRCVAQAGPVGDNGVRTFLWGDSQLFAAHPTYARRFGLDHPRPYTLNKTGDELAMVDNMAELAETGLLSFIATHPQFVLHKYLGLLSEFLGWLTLLVVPSLAELFARSALDLLAFTAWLFVAYALVRLRTQRPSVVFLALFAAPSLLLPLLHVKPIYLYPFLPFFLGGVALLVVAFVRQDAPAGPLWKRWRLLVVMHLLGLPVFWNVSESIVHLVDNQQLYPSNEGAQRTAAWIVRDADQPPRQLRIMSRKTIVPYYAGTQHIGIPLGESWSRVTGFALHKGVDYIVLCERLLGRIAYHRLFADVPPTLSLPAGTVDLVWQTTESVRDRPLAIRVYRVRKTSSVTGEF